MVQVRPVDQVFDVAVLLVSMQPLVLLIHQLLERVSKVEFTLASLDLLVERWVQLQHWVVLMFGHVFEKASCSHVVPVLRVVVQEPSITVFWIHCGLVQQI